MSHLKIIAPALILFTIVLTTDAARADYQNQADLSIYQTEDADNDTSDGTGLFYNYYFNSVDTSKGPWAEAGFINRAGNIGLSVTRFDSTFGTTNSESNSNFLDVTISNPESPFVITAGYRTRKADYKSSITFSAETSGYGLYIGYFVQQYTLIAFERDESKTEYSGVSQSNNYESDTNTVSANVLLLRDNGSALSLHAAYSVRKDTDSDEFKTTYLSGTYYPNPQLGIGGSIMKLSANIDAANSYTYGFIARYFMSPQIQLHITHSQRRLDSGYGTDSKTIQIGGSIYF